MTDSSTTLSTLQRVLTALAEHGPTTAAKLGESIGIAYPTTTPKLRELESAGHAERVRTDQRTTLWQLTDTGKAAAAALTPTTGGVEASAAPTTDTKGPAQPEPHIHPSPEPEPEPRGDAPPQEQPQGTPAVDPSGEPQTDSAAAETRLAAPAEAEAASPAATDHVAVPRPASKAEPVLDPQPETGSEAAHNQPAPQAPDGSHTDEPQADPAVDTKEQTPPQATEPEARVRDSDGRRKPAQPRRRKGELRDEVLALLRRNPDTAYKVGEICKLLNQAHDGDAVNKASAGAVANALDKLVIAGTVTRLDTKVATYRAE
ncbi:MarR family transcriptional regulator [Micromonospora sp. DT233]|uniref:MarR family transcriptional regulator n=1 Tax=Micromonospora sp. DT233 TaxID=3393432 RepID=UPI003CF9F926